MTAIFRAALPGLSVLAVLLTAPRLAALPTIRLEKVLAGQTHAPVDMVSSSDGSGRLFIADQRGTIRIFKGGMLLPGTFLDISDRLVPERARYDERGLLGLAFHPGFASPASPGFRRFYVFYNAPSPNAPGTATAPVDSRIVISEFQVSAGNPEAADPSSERVLVQFDKPQFNHNGGALAFGPDGLLYFSVGDGGGSNDNHFGHTGGGAAPRPTNARGNAQDLTSWMGKIHRIDPLGTNGPDGRYGIPPDNPFASRPNGERPEIFAYGLRNCWRFSFDSRPGGTGALFAADVGQGSVEEINRITAPGGNYGWRNREGSFVPSFSIDAPPMPGPAIDPIAQYAHPGVVIGSPPLPQLGLSVTGGFVYRGRALPALAGAYIFADWSASFTEPAGRLLALKESLPGQWALTELDVTGGNPIPYFIQAFGQDDDGELYVLTRSTPGVSEPDPATGLPAGVIFKIVPPPATTTVTLTASRDNSLFEEGDLSNGAGSWIFAGATDPGKNNAALRRALVAWDLSPLAPGSSVAAASVTLDMDRTISGAFAFSLHRMESDWGEGTTNAPAQEGEGVPASATDATWSKPFFGQASPWNTPGGDFAPEPSATTVVTGTGTVPQGIYTWSSPGLARDVNSWLTNPSRNFGWLLKAEDEPLRKSASGSRGGTTLNVDSTTSLKDGMNVRGPGIPGTARIATGGIDPDAGTVTLTAALTGSVNGPVLFGPAPTAKRFHSRSSTTPASRPLLILSVVPPPPTPSHRRAWESAYYLPGQFINDAWDTEGDGIPDGLEYAWGFNPRAHNRIDDGLRIDGPGVAAGGPLTITFRRDPSATDLTYRLQASPDLRAWTDLAVSTAGAPPAGPGFLDEAEIPGQPPFRSVTVRDPAPGSAPRFIRLHVERQP